VRDQVDETPRPVYEATGDPNHVVAISGEIPTISSVPGGSALTSEVPNA